MRMLWTLGIAAALSLAAFAQTRGIEGTSGSASAAQKWAVIIGVGAYDDPALSALPNAVRDAKAIHGALTKADGGYDARNVILMTEDAEDRLHRPTRSNILAILGQWVSLAGPDDSLLVYFAGHGVEDNGNLVLMPLDGRAADIANTGIPYSLFEEKLDQSAAKRSLVVLDACHSGTGRSSDVMTRGMMSDIEKHSEGRITLASCKENERSHEYEDAQHGAFTWFLLQGLGGGADANSDSWVSALELSNYTFEETRRWAAAKGISQTPRLISDISGDIVLAKVTFANYIIPLDSVKCHYEVKQGDTYLKIAKDHGVSIEELLAANGNRDPDQIYLGEVLTIPYSSSVVPENQSKATGSEDKPLPNFSLSAERAQGQSELVFAGLVGDVYVRPSDADDSIEWSYLGPGKGRVNIPSNHAVKLVARIESSQFSSLRHLAPEMIYALDVSLSKLDDESLSYVTRLVNLRVLDADNARVSNAGLTLLGELRYLRRLSLNSASGFDETGLAKLKSLKRLEELELRNTSLSIKAVEELREALPGCKISR